MKKILRLGIALMIAFSAGIGLTAFADEKEVASSLTVNETQVSYGNITEVGRSYTKYITLKNNTAADMVVRLEVTNYNDKNESSATDWIAFAGGKRKYDIKADSSVQVGLRLMVPNDAKGGTYYAKVKADSGKEDEKVEIIVRADVASEDYKYGGEIAEQSVGFFNLGDSITAKAKVKNIGTAGFSAHYLVQYKNAFGLSEWKQVAEETCDVIPGAEETFTVADERAKVGYGIFTVEQRISYVDTEGKQKEVILSHAVINLPWWVLAIVGGAIVLIVAIIIVIKNRRKKAE